MSREFDLKRAMAGEPVCTRAGRKARIITFDRKGSFYPLVTLVDNFDGPERVLTHTTDGRWCSDVIDDDDLMMEEVEND